ncbi:hypothetical protein HNY73_001256 [Argiope bruennichi]|uniref:Uncharacterized protein n=1 Tax=Argiope bruennichi TaxID=94029 RepID=A0A8T0G3A2_ARGBR|nr:hypothetical protein HNY73_001256 [Argiope bruennichi]
MEFNSVPSLLHITSVRIALRLLQDIEIEKMLDLDIMRPYRLNSFDRGRHDLWKLIEKTAMEKLPPLPPSLPIQVAKFIRQMHYEFVSWLLDHNLMSEEKGCCINYRKFICWKTDGTINRIKTAEKFIEDEEIEHPDRLIVACNYLFVCDILRLWRQRKVSGTENVTRAGNNSAVRVWMHLLTKGNKKHVHEVFRDFFRTECLSESDIPLRLSSYFRFLSLECRRDYLVNYSFAIHADDFRLCLFQMSEQERTELFQTMPRVVLMNYLNWPLQYLFLKMAKELVQYLDLADFENIMDGMLSFLFLNEYDYASLFKEFWTIIPDCFKVELRKDIKRFKPFEIILNYDRKLYSKSLVETLAEYCYE